MVLSTGLIMGVFTQLACSLQAATEKLPNIVFKWLVVLCCAAFGAEALADVTSRSPNVILILADDLGYGDLSCYGATKIKPPNIDLIAKKRPALYRCLCVGGDLLAEPLRHYDRPLRLADGGKVRGDQLGCSVPF